MNVLAIGAHFDDIELGCGGTIARHVAGGDQVVAYVVTRSGYVGPDNATVRGDDVALAEGREAIAGLGAELVAGTFPTFGVQPCDELYRSILVLLETHRIDRVYTHWAGDVHADHHAVALASLHCCRHVPTVLAYRSNWYDAGTAFAGGYYVDISDYWAAKEDAIRCHRSEVERTEGAWISYFRNEAENAGRRAGVQLAEEFSLVRTIESK